MTEKEKRLEALREVLSGCRRCPLCSGRKKIVFGDGTPECRVMWIGEAPGMDEDLHGLPFIGRSGKLLRSLIQAIKMDPQKDCYIANVVKCRPPSNRPPEDEEIEICVKFLQKQVEIIQPDFLILLGRTAVKGLLSDHRQTPIKILRDKSKNKELTYQDIPVIVTYHPSALLRDPAKKKEAGEDFRYIQSVINCLYEPLSSELPF